MEKTSAPSHWWDWASIGLLFILLETLASRLVTTNWTPFLNLTQTTAYLAFVVGTALGYSRFSRRVSQWLSVFYMLIMLPLQWTFAIDQKTSLEEQLSSVAGRLFFSTGDFFARRPVDDPLFFVAIMTIVFWSISAWAGFTLVRNQNYLGSVIPSAIGMLIIQNYDHPNAGRLWFLAFFIFIALLLLGRLHFLQNRKSWRERRVFLSPDNTVDLTSSMAIAAGLMIIVSWSIPASVSSWDSALRTWNKFTEPWREFAEDMESAVSAIDSPSGGKRGEFYGSELPLGRGFPLSDSVMFTVQAPDVPSEIKPPRYYWRGRVYDYFGNGQWYTTGTERVNFSPQAATPTNVDAQEASPARFGFNTGDSIFSLLYSPSQPVWVSRPGQTFNRPGELDVVAWHALPALRSGETYQVDAALKNPNLLQLREAGTAYPEWVTTKYLQLPETFSPEIKRLAEDITAGAETPFDKAVAVTNYLRENIEYAPTVPETPGSKDTLEWILFEYKKGFCVYYASAEVVMLRSIGIPARMVAGFAEGEREANTYTVRKFNAHAWPEVFFPGIGWVEFEPTGNQLPLDRPLPPRDPSELDNSGLIRGPLQIIDGLNPRSEELLADETTGAPQGSTAYNLVPLLLLLPILFAIVIFLVNRRYPLATHMPVFVRSTMERTGIEVPRWIVHWEYWAGLSPVQKAFESVNFGLRTLGTAVPVHNTPVERADRLMNLLPDMSEQIKIVLDEHQTSLYTSRVANVIQARQAAFNIRKQVMIERFRHLLFGKPLRS